MLQSWAPNKEGWRKQLCMIQEQMLTVWQASLLYLLQLYSLPAADPHHIPILCSSCHSLLIDHQLQIRGSLTIRGRHGNAELLLHERCKDWLCFTPSHSGNEGQSSFSYYCGGLSTHWRPVTSLNVADFPKCLTICSVLLTMCLCCQSHRGEKNQSTSYFLLMEYVEMTLIIQTGNPLLISECMR